MSGCDIPSGEPGDPRLLLHALADGELDAATAMAVERRLMADPALAAEYAAIVALKAATGRVERPAISADLVRRIETIGRPPAPARARVRSGAAPWRALAASVILTAALSSGVTMLALRREPGDGIADAIASSHRRSLLAATPVDVASSDRHTVKPWFDAKLGLSPPAIDLADAGFALVGGRVDVIGDRPLPSLVYRHREHLITLLAAPRAKSGTQAGEADAAVPAALAGGFNMVHWSDATFSYWAVTDMERTELDDFVARFRAKAAG